MNLIKSFYTIIIVIGISTFVSTLGKDILDIPYKTSVNMQIPAVQFNKIDNEVTANYNLTLKGTVYHHLFSEDAYKGICELKNIETNEVVSCSYEFEHSVLYPKEVWSGFFKLSSHASHSESIYTTADLSQFVIDLVDDNQIIIGPAVKVEDALTTANNMYVDLMFTEEYGFVSVDKYTELFSNK